MDQKLQEIMISEARAAQRNAYVPYSKFPVGAAILTERDQIFSGANVENISYGLSNCAERTTIFNAVSSSYRKFTALVVVSNGEEFPYPCGACRQVVIEFGEQIEILLVNGNNERLTYTSGDLLPKAFTDFKT